MGKYQGTKASISSTPLGGATPADLVANDTWTKNTGTDGQRVWINPGLRQVDVVILPTAIETYAGNPAGSFFNVVVPLNISDGSTLWTRTASAGAGTATRTIWP